MLVGHRHRRVADEGGTAHQQLVEQTPGGVDVGAIVDGLTTSLLRGKVLGGADDSCRLGHRRRGVCHRSSDTEVHDLDRPVAGEHDVGRFDVAVDDAGCMGVRQGVEHPHAELQGTFGQDLATVPQHLTQGVALHQLHDDVGHRHVGGRIGGLAGVVDGYDVRVVQPGRRLCLTLEPGLEGGITGQIDAQALDGDQTPQPVVTGLPHLGHAAATNDVE